MSALTYLSLTRLKNSVKELLHKPSHLIYVFFLLALCVFAVVGSKGGSGPAGTRSAAELTAIVTGLYTAMFLLTAWNGFSRGGSMFTMTDVNLIFPSPLPRTRVLFYGLFRQISTSLLLGLFLFYQYSWLHNLYGIRFSTLVGIFLGYVATVFLGQVTAMTIYAFTSSNEGLKNVLKGIFYALLLLIVLSIGQSIWHQGAGQLLSGVVTAANRFPVLLFPVGGWLGWIFSAAISGGFWLPGLVPCVAWLILLVRLLTYFDKDWYEDVIQTAELAQSAIAAKKEGSLDAAPRKVKVGAVGLYRGYGASAFYYKHKLENRRGNVLLLSRFSLLFAVIIILIAFFLRSSGVIGVFCFATYMQLFSTAQTRLTSELTKPYIYLVPEPPFSKLLQCMWEMIPSIVAEAMLIFIPVGLILSLTSREILLCVFARISYSFLFSAGNLIVERFWSGASKALTILFYIVLMLLLILPGAAVGAAAVFLLSLPGGFLTGLLFAALCNFPISFLVLFLCRNMLAYVQLDQ